MEQELVVFCLDSYMKLDPLSYVSYSAKNSLSSKESYTIMYSMVLLKSVRLRKYEVRNKNNSL